MTKAKAEDITIHLTNQIEQSTRKEYPTLPNTPGKRTSVDPSYTYYEYRFLGNFIRDEANKHLTLNLTDGLTVEFELIADRTVERTINKRTINRSNPLFPKSANPTHVFHCAKMLNISSTEKTD